MLMGRRVTLSHLPATDECGHISMRQHAARQHILHAVVGVDTGKNSFILLVLWNLGALGTLIISAAENGFLVRSQHLRVIDRTMMMHLPPFPIRVSPKDASGADRESHRLSTHVQLAGPLGSELAVGEASGS